MCVYLSDNITDLTMTLDIFVDDSDWSSNSTGSRAWIAPTTQIFTALYSAMPSAILFCLNKGIDNHRAMASTSK